MPHWQLPLDTWRPREQGHRGTDEAHLPVYRRLQGEIPGQAAKDCGNYLLHDLPMAKYESKKYLEEVLNVIKEENLIYPTQD